MNPEVKKYMAEIGAKGGRANKGKASEKCRAAVRVRWEKYRAQKAAEAASKNAKGDAKND